MVCCESPTSDAQIFHAFENADRATQLQPRTLSRAVLYVFKPIPYEFYFFLVTVPGCFAYVTHLFPRREPEKDDARNPDLCEISLVLANVSNPLVRHRPLLGTAQCVRKGSRDDCRPNQNREEPENTTLTLGLTV